MGRKPNTADISDESFPIELDELGRVQVDDFCKTNYENIYAVGDIVRGASLVVWAIRDGKEAAEAIIEKCKGAQTIAAE